MPKFNKRFCFNFSLSPSASLISCAALTAFAASGCSSDVTRFQSNSLALADNSLSSSLNSSQPVKGPYSLGQTQTEVRYYSPSESYEQPISRMELPPPSAPAQVSSEISRASSFENNSDTLSSPNTSEERNSDTFYRLSQRSGLTEEDLISLNIQKSSLYQQSEKSRVPSQKVASLSPKPVASGLAERPSTGITFSSPSQNAPVGASLSEVKESKKDEPKIERPQTTIPVIKRQTSTYTPLPLLPSEQASPPQSASGGEKGLVIADLNEKSSTSKTEVSASPSLRLLNDSNTKENQSDRKDKSAEEGSQISSSPQDPQQLASTQQVSASQPVSQNGTDIGRLRWPVKGRVISPFGPRSNGGMNDGIDISVPLGTDIHAAEDGVVAYAGNQLEAYGNLVLIKHQGGVVTAYAHAEEIKVKKGDRVNRGQVIATAGKTGAVDQPKLHFEVREGPKPVDPLLHLEKI